MHNGTRIVDVAFDQKSDAYCMAKIAYFGENVLRYLLVKLVQFGTTKKVPVTLPVLIYSCSERPY